MRVIRTRVTRVRVRAGASVLMMDHVDSGNELQLVRVREAFVRQSGAAGQADLAQAGRGAEQLHDGVLRDRGAEREVDLEQEGTVNREEHDRDVGQ
jgi:hypothetical protein